MDCRQKGSSIFGISGGNPPPTLQFEKSIFDKMLQMIDILIITHQTFTTFPRRRDWLDAIFLEDSQQNITVIPLVRRKIFSAVILSTSLQACEQSATVSAVTNILSGIPCASTAKCIFELSPLLCVPCPDCHRLLLQHTDVP